MKSLNSAWKETAILPFFLVFFIVILFFILPFSDGNKFIQRLITVFLAINMVIGVISINSNKTIKNISILIAFLVTTIEIISIETDSSPFRIFAMASWICFFCCLLYIFLIKVFESKINNIHRIQGGIACYLLLGIIFSFVHSLIFFNNNEAYNLVVSPIQNNLVSYQFIYYSYTTLTTTGFGDISTLTPIAQAASNLEGIIGVLFPTVLLGYLISDSTSQKR